MHQHSSSAKEQSQAHSHFQVECEADRDARSEPPAELRQSGPERAGVRPCNTDPPKLTFFAGGLDWLKLYVFGGLCPERLRGVLEKAKKAAETDHPDRYIELGERLWQVQDHGEGKGSNSMAYLLCSGGLRLALNARESGPCAMIEAQGAFCAGRAPFEVFEELKDIVRDVGCSIIRTTVSRLDIHADMLGLPMSRVAKAHNNDQIVRRAKEFGTRGFGRACDVETLYVGSRSSSVFARIYDKSRELSKNDEKAAHYKSIHGLSEVPEVLTRVEFELGGDFFRETWRAEDAEEGFKSLGTIARYLTHDWIRVCHHVDRNNTQKAKAVAWWQYMSDRLVMCMAGQGNRGDRLPVVPDTDRLKKQVVGTLASLCARLGVNPGDVDGACRQLVALVKEEDNLSLRDKVELRYFEFDQRRRQIEARSVKAFERSMGSLHGGSCHVVGAGLEYKASEADSQAAA